MSFYVALVDNYIVHLKIKEDYGKISYCDSHEQQKKRRKLSCLLTHHQNGKLKYIYLNLSAFENEWDKNADRFKRDKRMNPNYESYNNWLISCEERKMKW